MVKALDKAIKLEEGQPVLGAASQKHVESLLRKAADQAAKAAKRKWKSAGRNPFAKHAKAGMGAFERAFRNALENALKYHANNSGPRPSIKMTAPDTGGRPFHFSHTTVSASGASKSYKVGTTAAHMSYIDRELAVEQAMLEEGAELSLSSRAIDAEAFGRDPADRMQSYIEDKAKVEAGKLRVGQKDAQPFAFTFGNIGETKEERRQFWELIEAHPERGNARLQSRVVLELPVESTPAQRLKIVQEYTKGLEERGLRYHAALHAPTDKNDPRNFHAHVIYMNRPARKVDFAFDGFDDGTDKPKAKIWDFACVAHLPDENKHRRKTYPERQNIDPETRKKTFITSERKRLAKIVNAVMSEAGSPVRYDPRSYRAMGLEVEAMKSISRIVADKAKGNKRIVLDVGRTKREIEAEVQRLARERAPEFAEISRVRTAVRNGESALRALEKEAGFLRRKPIRKRGAYAVDAFVRRRALDYARTRALHLERTIEAAQQLRSIERVIEATEPKTVAKLRGRLAESIVKARASGNKRELARLKTELETIPKVAYAAILHKVATEEAAALRDKQQSRAKIRLGKVKEALARWTSAANGEPPEILPARTAPGPAVAGVAPPQAQAAPIRQPKPDEHPMWAPLDEVAAKIFTTPVAKFAWEMHKRFGQFIIDNADPDVPGRTPMDLADKLIEAVKEHPAKAEAMILSYNKGNNFGLPLQEGESAAFDEPVFRGSPPRAAPGVREEDAATFGMSLAPWAGAPLKRQLPGAHPVQCGALDPELGPDAPAGLEAETGGERREKKRRQRLRERQRAILAQRAGRER